MATVTPPPKPKIVEPTKIFAKSTEYHFTNPCVSRDIVTYDIISPHSLVKSKPNPIGGIAGGTAMGTREKNSSVLHDRS